jgi:hypothetical protein
VCRSSNWSIPSRIENVKSPPGALHANFAFRRRCRASMRLMTRIWRYRTLYRQAFPSGRAKRDVGQASSPCGTAHDGPRDLGRIERASSSGAEASRHVLTRRVGMLRWAFALPQKINGNPTRRLFRRPLPMSYSEIRYRIMSLSSTLKARLWRTCANHVPRGSTCL